MTTQLNYWHAPKSRDIAPSAVEFLRDLPGPMHIHLPGHNTKRCRIVVTLLHGNEPSGLTAIHALLRQGVEPSVDMHFFIPAVAAARQTPLFFYRMLPGEHDLNRCFRPPFADHAQGRLAKMLLETWRELKPEAMIDIHNTSGAGPSFGVATFMDRRHEALVSLFTHRLVITDLDLGSVMELSGDLCPTVTIECGGARDEESDRMALIGLTQFISMDDVLTFQPGDVDMDFFHHPIRLELKPNAAIGYGTVPLETRGVNLLPDVEHLNFNIVAANTSLGYITGDISQVLQAETADGEDKLTRYFRAENGQLLTNRKMKFFMVTNNPEIARTDCLLYLVEVT